MTQKRTNGGQIVSAMTAQIERATSVLTGKVLWRCLRAADMATFDFGERTTISASRGGTREVGEYALHVQCAWRVTTQDRVIVGNRDLYYPADYSEGKEVSPSFDYEKDYNRRDKLLTSLFENGTREFVVREVHVGTAGRIHILLTEGLALELFPNDSLTDEHWRLFEPGKEDRHFVVTGKGVET